MQPYQQLLQRILDEGVAQPDRTGTGTLSVFGHQMRFDLADGFPLVTTKKLHLRSIIIELLWFLKGDTNVAWLKENKVSIWNEWADAAGDLGPVYGKQWRDWEAPDGRHIDQIAQLLDLIRRDPASRRQIVSVPDPGRERPPQPPALSAQRRRLPRRPLQHRQLRPPRPHARPAGGA